MPYQFILSVLNFERPLHHRGHGIQQAGHTIRKGQLLQGGADEHLSQLSYNVLISQGGSQTPRHSQAPLGEGHAGRWPVDPGNKQTCSWDWFSRGPCEESGTQGHTSLGQLAWVASGLWGTVGLSFWHGLVTRIAWGQECKAQWGYLWSSPMAVGGHSSQPWLLSPAPSSPETLGAFTTDWASGLLQPRRHATAV